ETIGPQSQAFEAIASLAVGHLLADQTVIVEQLDAHAAALQGPVASDSLDHVRRIELARRDRLQGNLTGVGPQEADDRCRRPFEELEAEVVLLARGQAYGRARVEGLAVERPVVDGELAVHPQTNA